MALRLLAILVLLVNHAAASLAAAPRAAGPCARPGATECCCGDESCPCLAESAPTRGTEPVPVSPNRAPAPGDLFPALPIGEVPAWDVPSDLPPAPSPRSEPSATSSAHEALAVLCVWQT